ncbi:MAG TPA: cyclase family protein [Actinomycetota bacterium]|nr:cyclase family protein [Actinomycetota bacterium]
MPSLPDAPTIRDVSLGIHPRMLTWPSDPGVSIAPASRISAGKSANVSELHCGTHTGTHIDPPLHFIENGTPVDRLDLDALIGPAVVADLTRVEYDIGPAELDSLNLGPGVERLLFHTRNSEHWRHDSPEFTEDYVAVTADGARWLVDHGIRLVGIDYLSVEHRRTPGHPTHMTLLGAGVVIVEGLNLDGVPAGDYTLLCLPIKLVDGDGGPARALLLS